MTDLAAHGVAVRRLRKLARERNCIVEVRPVVAGPHSYDVYSLIDYDTGQVRGEIKAHRHRLDRIRLDDFFAKEMA